MKLFTKPENRTRSIGHLAAKAFARAFTPCASALLCIRVFAAETSFQPERVLPDDTLLLATAPELPKAITFLEQTPYGRLWKDPLLKPFRDNFQRKVEQQLLKPFRDELGIGEGDWNGVFRGSLTFAVTRDSWDGKSTNTPGWILILDADSRSADLRAKLSAVRDKWVKTGKPVRDQTIAGHTFSAVQLSTNSVFRGLRELLPVRLNFENPSTTAKTNTQPAYNELIIGQVNTLLLLGSSPATLEKVVSRLSGGSTSALADQQAYRVCHDGIFTNAAIRFWVNTKPLLDACGAAGPSPAPPVASDELNYRKLLQSSGLAALKSAGLAAFDSPEGCWFELLLDVPEPGRQGLFKLLAGESKDVSVPERVPADIVHFQRWRIQGLSAWNTFQQMMSQISPQWTGTIDFIINTANEAARLKDPSFELRTNLLGNLGDDFIRYSKSPGPTNLQQTGPSLMLVASPHPDQIAAALQRVLIFLSAEAENPVQREFQGHKIYSVPLPPVPLPFESLPSVPPGRTLHYSATSNYVAISTDLGIIEEYLRTPNTNAAPLNSRPGLREAAALVANPATSLFLYENQAALVRTQYEAERLGTTSTNQPGTLVPASLGLAKPATGLQDFFDFSLLPPFDTVSKHFSFLVRGSGPSQPGILVRWFIPTPAPASK